MVERAASTNLETGASECGLTAITLSSNVFHSALIYAVYALHEDATSGTLARFIRTPSVLLSEAHAQLDRPEFKLDLHLLRLFHGGLCCTKKHIPAAIGRRRRLCQ
ncbi:hypothetical protein MTP99_013897 [Tenebrio molitor]|jgi:hypothetical protein|nr:hypothetical protein MTP99_013897 [Tenebrio molitor]